MYSTFHPPLSPLPPSKTSLESLLNDCRILKNLLKKYKKTTSLTSLKKSKRRERLGSSLKTFKTAPDETRVDWLLSLFGEGWGGIDSDYFNTPYTEEDKKDDDIVTTLEEANKRWIEAYSTIQDCKNEKKERISRSRAFRDSDGGNKKQEEHLTGVAKVFCSDSSQPDVWKKVLIFCGFDTMKNLREVSSGFNKKVDRVVVRDYFEVVTRSIGGLGEVNSLVESSIDTAPVLLPWGKGMIIQEWKRKDPLWKYLCKGWGISTQKMLDEANKQRRGFNVKPIVEAVAGLGVILLDPDWHEQTLMDKYEIYTKVEHSIWNFTGGKAGRQRSEGQTMGVEMREKFAKRREGLFHLILKSTEMTYASIVFKLLTPEKRLVYENISELLKSWRSSQGNLHICKELRNASKIYEAIFRLICNVMDAAKSIEDYMRVRESGYDGMKEIIYKEGHRQARTHLEHHQLLNLMNLLEKQMEATKSFNKWYKRVKAKERALVERAERRKLLYSQERTRADSAGFRVRGRTESEPLFGGSVTE